MGDGTEGRQEDSELTHTPPLWGLTDRVLCPIHTHPLEDWGEGTAS